jgi:hypothetical protein
MSTLEANAKAVLVPYINGERNITQISESDALVVARWTLKTAVILSARNTFAEAVAHAAVALPSRRSL